MEDELRFDLSTSRWVNVGESRHRGVEAGLEVGGLPVDGTLFAAYTLHDTEAREGPFEGRAHPGVPRHQVSGAVTWALPYVDAGLFVSRSGGGWLDAANTVPLPAYTRLDAQIGIPVADVRLAVIVRNVFDSLHSTTGFVAPFGPGTTYLFPAAGRMLEIALGAGTR